MSTGMWGRFFYTLQLKVSPRRSINILANNFQAYNIYLIAINKLDCLIPGLLGLLKLMEVKQNRRQVAVVSNMKL